MAAQLREKLSVNYSPPILRPREGMALFRAMLHNPMDHITDQFVEQMVELLQSGVFPETAANSLGIPSMVWRKWWDTGMQICTLIEDDPKAMNLMTDDEEKLVMLFQAVGQALSEYEMKAVSRIERAAEFDWAAGAWLLSKKFKNRWGKQADTSVVVNNNLNTGVLAVAPQQPMDQWAQTFQEARSPDENSSSGG